VPDRLLHLLRPPLSSYLQSPSRRLRRDEKHAILLNAGGDGFCVSMTVTSSAHRSADIQEQSLQSVSNGDLVVDYACYHPEV
jgi:hypothetical protein